MTPNLHHTFPQTPVYHWGKNFSDKIDLSHSPKILDVGCRRGAISSYVASLYPNQHFTAIDNLSAEIEQAQDHRQPNLSFEKADVQSLSCSNHFDAVVSFSCLHWVKDKAKAVNTIHKSLKPGGKAFLQFFAKHGRPKNDRFLYQTAQNSEWKGYFGAFSQHYYEVTLGDFALFLQNAGFIIHSLEIVKYGTFFDHPEHLQQWLRTWASHKEYLPTRKIDSFFRDSVGAYMDAHHLSTIDPFLYNEYVLEVICEKPLHLEKEQRYGGVQLTPREISVLKCFLQGKVAKEIAFCLGISPKTVEFHLSNIKEKLNCSSRSDIYRTALSQGFIGLIFDT